MQINWILVDTDRYQGMFGEEVIAVVQPSSLHPYMSYWDCRFRAKEGRQTVFGYAVDNSSALKVVELIFNNLNIQNGSGNENNTEERT